MCPTPGNPKLKPINWRISNGKINNFRVGNKDYWTNDKALIIISFKKGKILYFLNEPKLTSEIAKEFKVSWKSLFRRLNELKNLNLVKREINKTWVKLQTKKKILVI